MLNVVMLSVMAPNVFLPIGIDSLSVKFYFLLAIVGKRLNGLKIHSIGQGCHDTRHNDTQLCDIQHIDTQHNNSQW